MELDSSTPAKFSRHLIVRAPGAAFASNFHCGAFVQSLLEPVPAACAGSPEGPADQRPAGASVPAVSGGAAMPGSGGHSASDCTAEPDWASAPVTGRAHDAAAHDSASSPEHREATPENAPSAPGMPGGAASPRLGCACHEGCCVGLGPSDRTGMGCAAAPHASAPGPGHARTGACAGTLRCSKPERNEDGSVPAATARPQSISGCSHAHTCVSGCSSASGDPRPGDEGPSSGCSLGQPGASGRSPARGSPAAGEADPGGECSPTGGCRQSATAGESIPLHEQLLVRKVLPLLLC